jgi:hypothetical protein
MTKHERTTALNAVPLPEENADPIARQSRLNYDIERELHMAAIARYSQHHGRCVGICRWRRVECLTTGKQYPSIASAAEAEKVDRVALTWALRDAAMRGETCVSGGKEWKYFGEPVLKRSIRARRLARSKA